MLTQGSALYPNVIERIRLLREYLVVPAPRHPRPEVCARAATVAELAECRSAVRVIKSAEKAGWIVRPTYARGIAVMGTGKGSIVHSLALRMWRGRQRIVVVYLKTRCGSYGFEEGYAWDETRGPTDNASRLCGTRTKTSTRMSIADAIAIPDARVGVSVS